MKTRRQIVSLLSNRRSASETDKVSILSFCEKKKETVSFPRDRASLAPISYEQFTSWYKAPHYELGEVITDSDNAVYLITDFADGESVSTAHLDPGGKFSTKVIPLPVSKGSHRKSSREEKKALQRAMNKKGLTWNPHKQSIMPYDHPEKNYYVTIWVVNELVGMGIFKEVDAEGNLILYCSQDTKGVLTVDSHFVFGPVTDYAVREARSAERAEIIRELNHANLVWHGRLKRFEPLKLRRRAGGKYYYIDSIGRILLASEKNSKADEGRFKVGNYFLSLKEAEDFKRQIVLMRNEQFVGKEPHHD